LRQAELWSRQERWRQAVRTAEGRTVEQAGRMATGGKDGGRQSCSSRQERWRQEVRMAVGRTEGQAVRMAAA
jgi:hypothetical protein